MPTVVLVHGAWLDSSSWDAWCERYEARGELKAYEGRSHRTILEPGWEQLDDDVIAWAEEQP